MGLARLAACGALALGLATSSLAEAPRRSNAARLMNELMSGKASVGGPFTLTDQNDKRRSLSDFRGKLVLLYFGYTSCPDVCPTDLAAMAHLMALMEADADQIQPVFVTLDPARDTAAVLREYTRAFDARFVGLRGTEAETRHVATLYKTYYEKVRPTGSKTYVIDHTGFIYLIDRDGHYVAFFPPGTLPERMQVMVREVLTPGGR
ncbi:MAG: SCO family protein [Rhodocyclaceae bacterium]|nr:MAG: SCO family protein [Rhodocyclaceae bacterium]